MCLVLLLFNLHTNSYQFPIESKKISDQKNEPDDENFNINCYDDMKYSISTYSVGISCSYSVSYQIPFSQINNYYFFFYDRINETYFHHLSITNNTYDNEQIEEILKILISHTYMNDNVIITFYDFYYRPELLQSSLKLVNENTYVKMSINIKEIVKYDRCPWESAIYANNTVYTKEYFDQIAQKFGWTKICINYTGYLLYEGENQVEIIIIPKKLSFTMIALIILVIFIMILSFILIAFCKYKRDNRNDSEEELNDHSEQL